jgi:hypothetical protein
LLARLTTTLLLVIALAGALATAATQPASALTFINIDGHVYLPGGAPAAGVCIIMRAAPDQCLPTDRTTDAQGYWTIGQTFPIVGNQSVWYVLNGYEIGHDTIPGTQTTDWHGSFTLTAKAGTTPPPPPPAACGAAGQPTSTVYLPNITKTLGGPAGWYTPFIAQNIGTAATDLEVSFYKFSDGSLVTCRKVSALAPGTSFADVPNNDTDLPGDTQFSVVIKSFGAPVVSVVNQVQGSGATAEALSYTGSTSGATRVFVPNVTRRFFGYDVPLIIQNLGGASGTATASFVSFDGTKTGSASVSVQPGRSAVIDPNVTAGLVDGTQYAVTITADQPVAVVANAHNETGSPVAYSHNGLTQGATTLYAPYAAKSGPAGRYSPVVVQNLGTATADATLTFTPLGGGTPQTFALAGIPAGGAKAFDPRFSTGSTTPCTTQSATCLGAGEYSLVVTSPQPVAAVTLPVTATTADAYVAATAPTARTYLPNVTRTLGGPGGWTTPIVLQSLNATAATLKWYRFDSGALATTQTVTLPAGAAIWIDPSTVSGLSENTQYAVVVDAGTGTTATAIVYQLASGGDNAAIYSGFNQ